MRNIFVGLFVFFAFSCSTSDDKPSTDVVPLAPTELTGNLTDIGQVTLNWKDNSANETGFRIERKLTGSVNSNYSVIAVVGSNITSYLDKDLNTNTYNYRVSSFNSTGNSAQYSNEIILVSDRSKFIKTSDITYIASTTAISGGYNSDGTNFISYGLVWDTSQNPTISLPTKTTNGYGLMNWFESNIIELKPNTTYYIRAYGITSLGAVYGNEKKFTTALPPAPTNLAVGQQYQGGVIAYIYQPYDACYVPDETHGIIVAQSDQSTSSVWARKGQTWATDYEIGKGLSNTNLIMTNCSGSCGAVGLCYDLSLGGYSDWFLPSSHELLILFKNKTLIGGFNNSTYWSSTEVKYTSGQGYSFVDFAYKVDFSSSSATFGTINEQRKDTYAGVRAIRYF